MAITNRLNDQEATEIPQELAELGDQIQALPPPQRAALYANYERVVLGIQRRRRILDLVQEALSQLRVDIKYLMFDLDMTRKERDELQKQLESRE